MKNLDKYCINANTTINNALLVIQGNLSRCVIVVGPKNKVIGIISEGDIIRALIQQMDLHAPLKNILKYSFIYLKEKDLSKAYKIMKEYGITLIPVISDDFILKDVITIFEIFDFIEKRFEFQE